MATKEIIYTGTNGINGANGTGGIAGESGQSGSSGKTGGQSGKNGKSGKAGDSGTNGSHAESWGTDGGYGTDAVVTLVGHIFKTISSINKVYLHTLEWNSRARNSFAKAGFVEVREVKRDGQNFVLMETLRHESH